MSDLAAALQVTIRTHAAQTDRQGVPYLLHVLRVVEAVSDEAKVVAALHDVLEDGPSAEIGRAISLLSHNEVQALDLLTREDGQSYSDYIAAIARERYEDLFGDIACEVKLADLHDNLGRIPPAPNIHAVAARRAWIETWAPLKRRYEKAIATLEAAERTHA